METIYAVSATQLDRDQLLGYAIGRTEDIAAYYDSRKGYGLRIEPIKPLRIPDGHARRMAELVKKREAAEKALRQINREIDSL